MLNQITFYSPDGQEMTLNVGDRLTFLNTEIGDEENASTHLTRDLFDIYCYVKSKSKEQIFQFLDGTMNYGLFYEDDVPIFLLLFQDFSIATIIDIFELTTDEQITWFTAESTKLYLVLIDVDDDTIIGFRSIEFSKEFIDKFKKSLHQVLQKYDTESLDEKVKEIFNRYTVDDLMLLASMQAK